MSQRYDFLVTPKIVLMTPQLEKNCLERCTYHRQLSVPSRRVYLHLNSTSLTACYTGFQIKKSPRFSEFKTPRQDWLHEPRGKKYHTSIEETSVPSNQEESNLQDTLTDVQIVERACSRLFKGLIRPLCAN